MERLVRDFGPIYAETDISRIPVEPWNTASTLIFLVIVLLYLQRTGGDYNRFPFTVLVLPILFVGFAGGCIYHATRSHWIWLVLDFGPIFLLVLLAAYYFWRAVTHSHVKAGSLVCLFFALTALVRSTVEGALVLKISVGYSLLALNILLPAFLHAARRRWQDLGLLFFAPLFFVAAILFRHYDKLLSESLLPMGTHFLWHLFGGCSVFCLMEYVYRVEREQETA